MKIERGVLYRGRYLDDAPLLFTFQEVPCRIFARAAGSRMGEVVPHAFVQCGYLARMEDGRYRLAGELDGRRATWYWQRGPHHIINRNEEAIGV